jgi:hypothetical protein
VDVTVGGSSSSSDAGGSPPPSFVVLQDACPAADIAANSLCPVVAFSTFAGQLGFRAAMNVAVFGGEWVVARVVVGFVQQSRRP